VLYLKKNDGDHINLQGQKFGVIRIIDEGIELSLTGNSITLQEGEEFRLEYERGKNMETIIGCLVASHSQSRELMTFAALKEKSEISIGNANAHIKSIDLARKMVTIQFTAQNSLVLHPGEKLHVMLERIEKDQDTPPFALIGTFKSL
jgi:copper(I)-binding protein